jgi:hypothetical protein
VEHSTLALQLEQAILFKSYRLKFWTSLANFWVLSWTGHWFVCLSGAIRKCGRSRSGHLNIVILFVFPGPKKADFLRPLQVSAASARGHPLCLMCLGPVGIIIGPNASGTPSEKLPDANFLTHLLKSSQTMPCSVIKICVRFKMPLRCAMYSGAHNSGSRNVLSVGHSAWTVEACEQK